MIIVILVFPSLRDSSPSKRKEKFLLPNRESGACKKGFFLLLAKRCEIGSQLSKLPTLPEKRARNIFEQIQRDGKIKEKPGAILLANGSSVIDASFFYVTGFGSGLFEGSILLAKRGDGISLYTSPLEESIARASPGGIEIFANRDPQENRLKLRQRAGGVKILGLNYSNISVDTFNMLRTLFKGTKLVDISQAVARARLIKDESEINAIQKACDIASEVYSKVPELLKDGVTESQIAAELAFEMQRAGGSGVSFPSIVAFGKNASLPHYSPGAVKLRKGEFVLLDYGTVFRRYCSDITRTLVYGRASKVQRRMYDTVKEANEAGVELCTPENTGALVNSKVTEVIDSTEFKGRFIHSTGHSLGLDVHDGPALSSNVKSNLEPGMVVTVEPGIYVPSIGGVRIEDDVLITKGKPKVLTSAARKFMEV